MRRSLTLATATVAALVWQAAAVRPASAVLFEAGQLDLSGTSNNQTSFQSVVFSGAFSQPPVVVSMPTTAGGDPASVRVRNVTSTGFEIQMVEPPGEDGQHGAAMQNVTWYAMEPGRAQVAPGIVWEAGTLNTSTTVQHAPPFGDPGGFEVLDIRGHGHSPVLLSTIQTMANEEAFDPPPGGTSVPWMVVGIDNVTSGSAQIALDRGETNLGAVTADETIGYIAMSSGFGSFTDINGNPVSFQSLRTLENIPGWGNVGAGGVPAPLGPFASAPLVVASQNTRNGVDGGWLRRGTVSPSSVNLVVDEDQWNDTERNHADEAAGLLAVSRSFVADFAAAPAAKPIPLLEYDATLDISPNNGVWEDVRQVVTPAINWNMNGNPHVPAGGVPQRQGIDSAYSFDGSSPASSTTANIENFPGNPTDSTASFEWWFRPTDLIGQEVVWEAGGGTDGSSLTLDDATLQFLAKDNSNNGDVTADLSGISPTDYVHAVAVVDLEADEVSLFVNGALADTASFLGGDWAGSNAIGLGGANGAVGGHNGAFGGLNGYANFQGEIAIYRFYDHALRSSDVLALNQMHRIVPEPATAALLGLGAIGLLGRRRRRA